ncbi:MAG: hypothetical protein HY907_07900 [Deltaproteobacteria bacterium]|nr:hypothetical protein [Deltaproteobacteria bacterium]
MRRRSRVLLAVVAAAAALLVVVVSASVGDGEAPGDAVDDANPGAAGPAEAAGAGVREGASAGVACRKVPSPWDSAGAPAHGDGSRVVFAPERELPGGWYLRAPHILDWSTGRVRVIDDLSDLPALAGSGGFVTDLWLEGRRLAFAAAYNPSRTRVAARLQVLDLETGEKRTISEVTGELPGGATMDGVTLRYPWLAWEESPPREARALNLETGERPDLRALESTSLDLSGTTGVATGRRLDEVDLVTGATAGIRALSAGGDGWGGVITPGWIAWLDQRSHPECGWFMPCDTEIWGFDRRTRTEARLVGSPGMHGGELDGEGEWLAYTDQRDDPDPHRDSDRSQNVYALHLPTMTEIRVEDWPGYQAWVRVYRGVGEWRVLFAEERSYVPTILDLWDCSLPPLPRGG